MKLLMKARRGGKTHEAVRALIADPDAVLVTAFYDAAVRELIGQLMTPESTMDAIAFSAYRRRIVRAGADIGIKLQGRPAETRIIIDELGPTLASVFGYSVSLATTSGLEIVP